MMPSEAEIHFLENVKKLSMYGVDLHHAKVKNPYCTSLPWYTTLKKQEQESFSSLQHDSALTPLLSFLF